MALNIDGPDSAALSEAVASAFPAPHALGQALLYRLNDNISNYAGLYSGEYPQIRFNLIQAYNSRHQIDRLALALLQDNPTNERLLAFAWRHGIIKRPAGTGETPAAPEDALERMLDPARGFSDAMPFLRRFGEIIKCVCHVTLPTDGGTAAGTGLLVGDETVLTNYHVVERLIRNPPAADRRDLRVLFDFHTGPDGQTISTGVEYSLVDDDTKWLIASRPYHADDLHAAPLEHNLAASRPADHLDFALIRLSGKPGAQPVGRNPSPGGTVRGHIPLPADAAARFATDFDKATAAVFIFQHPTGKPLLFDYQRPGVLGVNANGTRVLYDVNTERGSSGAPCFNAKLELMALHHAGGKDWPAAAPYRYNQGIPIDKIHADLKQQMLLSRIV